MLRRTMSNQLMICNSYKNCEFIKCEHYAPHKKKQADENGTLSCNIPCSVRLKRTTDGTCIPYNERDWDTKDNNE